MYAQWDDHEVTNNWYWELRKDQDQRYEEGSVALLAARALRAFHDYMPTRLHPLEQDRLYTSFAYGPSLEVFRIDLRSYRGPNSEGMQTELSPEARIIGEQQLPWLMQALKDSRATWKVIACDMPIGLIVWDDFVKKQGVEAVAQGDMGAAHGPRARVRRAVPLHPRPEHQERRLADRRRALHRPPTATTRTARSSRSSRRSGSSSPGRSMPARSARTSWMPPSGRRLVFVKAPRPARSTCRPRPGCSSSARSTSTAPAR